MQQTFEFSAFAFSHYYKAVVVFFLSVMIVIVAPSMSLANYFLPDNIRISLFIRLISLLLISVPLLTAFLY